MTFIKPLPDSAPMIDTSPTMPAPTPTWKYPMPTQPSIDLRDWFAAKAMQGIFADPHHNTANMGGYDQIASHAYSLADAMMKAREAK